jgi:hypothetical protein
MLSSTARLSFKLERLNQTLGYHIQMFEIILGLDPIGKPDWLITWGSTILYRLASPHNFAFLHWSFGIPPISCALVVRTAVHEKSYIGSRGRLPTVEVGHMPLYRC